MVVMMTAARSRLVRTPSTPIGCHRSYSFISESRPSVVGIDSPSSHQPASFPPRWNFRPSSNQIPLIRPKSNSLRTRANYQGSQRNFQSGNINNRPGTLSPPTSKINLPSPSKLSIIILGSGLGGVLIWLNSSANGLESSQSLPLERGEPSKVLDPIESILLRSNLQDTSHLSNRPTSHLLKSYLTFLLCEIPGVVVYGPKVLEGYRNVCENVPFLGPFAWAGAEWLMRQTFFAHYTGGETPEGCLPVLHNLLDERIGTLLNYSVEGPDSHDSKQEKVQKDCLVSQRHIEAVIKAVQTASEFGSSSTLEPNYPPGSLRMRPTTLALKVSGLVTDPYVFKRASDSLISNNVSPFRPGGELFPPSDSSSTDPLSQADRRALMDLMENLRSICQKAKDGDVTLMIDAEYSWFQPALDRLATFLSAEFNQPPSASTSASSAQTSSPTVYNTFQALLRSTPNRIDEFLQEADKNNFSVGIKLVRGAYLVSETEHWKDEKSKDPEGFKAELPVWGSKEETDECFDSVALRLVNRLSNDARRAEKSVNTSNNKDDDKSSSIGSYFYGSKDRLTPEVCLMVAGHNGRSIVKILKDLRDVEGLAKEDDNLNDYPTLCLSDSLRGRLMFAQLYGMADRLTGTVAKILESPSSLKQKVQDDEKVHLQPFVHKYLPYGPVSEVMPYLARRAEENQSMLKNSEGRSTVSLERKEIGREIKNRIIKTIF